MGLWQGKLGDSALQGTYGWSGEECGKIIAALRAFLDARTAYAGAPTKANHTEKEKCKTEGLALMRKFAREYIRNNPKMSDGHKQDLGVSPGDKEPSPVGTPDAGPESEAEINAKSPGVVKVRYLGAKPYGVDRIEIAWDLSGDAVDSPDLLPHKETFSRNPWEHTFRHDDRGKKLYYSLRYLTKEGESHWSDVREVIVP
jgi:hypothetical protein